MLRKTHHGSLERMEKYISARSRYMMMQIMWGMLEKTGNLNFLKINLSFGLVRVGSMDLNVQIVQAVPFVYIVYVIKESCASKIQDANLLMTKYRNFLSIVLIANINKKDVALWIVILSEKQSINV